MDRSGPGWPWEYHRDGLIGLRIRIAEGSYYPRFYGVSHRSIHTDSFACHPLPFNFVVGWLRRFRSRLKWGPAAPHDEYRRDYIGP